MAPVQQVQTSDGGGDACRRADVTTNAQPSLVENPDDFNGA